MARVMTSRRRRSRRGYTMLMVIVFLLVLLSLLGMAYRQMAATLRLEEARTRQLDVERGGLDLARTGLGMLEGEMTEDYVDERTYQTSAGPKTYRLTLKHESDVPDSEDEIWTVTLEPL